MRAVDFFPSYMRRVLGWLAGTENATEAVHRLEHEPLFVVETGEQTRAACACGVRAAVACLHSGQRAWEAEPARQPRPAGGSPSHVHCTLTRTLLAATGTCSHPPALLVAAGLPG